MASGCFWRSGVHFFRDACLQLNVLGYAVGSRSQSTCASLQIDIVNKIFVQNHENPPLYKNHPPVAGAIYWERSLFYRIKHTILRFQEVQEILDSERGEEVRGFPLSPASPLSLRITKNTFFKTESHA